ncbi:SusC/RagA family TonB-linked outer membrane protein [uncultured Alistipes sp.]|uniref:SusC/RagA family TonB-linked outer membrane protein n=1 Tax=uncultured Alistipes sp. TaxID=538949 RepID=UPI0025D9E572|nr:SusC/RagA family TonB-linked outer membrane protein [uncultured Alistipes sp.]
MKLQTSFQKRAYCARCGLRRILSVLLALAVATAALAVPPPSRDGKLTLNVKNITVKELLQTIEKQSRYTFVYNNSDFDTSRRVSLDVTDASVETVIAQAIPGVAVSVRGAQVVLVRRAAGKSRPDVKITGTVRDTDGVPLIGATLIVEGTTLGTSTGVNGEYALNVPANGRIVCSYLGYDAVTEAVNARTRIDFRLRAAANSIEDVVVTALGITRKEKSLGYAVSKIGSDDITNNASGNWLSGMAGKVAGLNLDQSSAGPGGSVRVTLRGEGSLSYNNNTALFVVDGVPIGSGMDSNSSSGSYESNDAPIDYGNGAGDINPDDVESISVLKGPAATALYGSRAANGAVIITTKSGRKQKGLGVTFTTSVTFDKAGYWPDFQYEYGAGDYRKTTINNGHMTNGLNPDEYSFYTVDADHSDTGKKVNAFASRYQFGEKIQGQMRYMYASYDPATDTYTRMPYKVYDWYKGFFQTGVTYTNSLAVDASDGHGSSLRVSIKDTRNDWIVPNTGFTTQNFGVSAVSKRNKYIEAGVKLNYYRKNSDNLPVGGYSNSSPLKTLLWQPVSASARDAYNEWKSGRLIDYYSGVDTSVKLINGSMDNPYFIVYDCLNTQSRDRVYGNASVTGHIIPGRLLVTLRSGLDFSSDFRTQCKPQYTHAYLDGMYREQTIRSMELNNDFLVSYHDTFGQLSLNASLGGNNMLYKYHNSRQTANMLEEPNVFILQNVNGTLDFANTRKTKSINSFYGLVSLGWRDMLFLDVTGRNDWSSTLAPGYNSYFYPSVSASVLLDEVFKLHDKAKWIDMLKVRGSWANVGNDTEPYQLWGAYANSSVFTGAYGLPGSTKNYTLKPENVESWELGFEGHFLQNRVSFDFAYYDSETTNQIINVPSDWATGASSMVINAGCVRNRGIELAARFRPVSTKNWRWDIDVNWSKNWNELVELAPGVNVWQLNASNTIGSKVFIYAYPGGELGRIYGYGLQTAPEGAFYYDADGRKVDCSGQHIVDAATGNPVLDATNLKDLGSIYPQWKAGLTTSLRYKGLTLTASFAASYSGRAYSLTNSILSYMGKLTNSLEGRYDGLVHPGVNVSADGVYSPNSTITTDAVDYYNTVIYPRGNTESNVFDTSYLKLKELRVEYLLPRSLCAKTKVFQNVSLSFFVTNVFCITNFPQFDPEVASLSGSSLYRGVETGAYPMTRSYGFSLKLGF